ncbi:DUF6443 domain-containing protein [Arcicella sp. LKC2W]|uniref:RHS repeat domain-containing protein n=1 Tax=Arcicella sp. LKC2W TaxID=2984198 RepID=UPI002B1EB98C|nr:DUF6443 domain-containing protein [Arcicella sp. LKC2W]MEA5462048.1 DUF6443 domain-containing protein [Arcicella sp. LKC2W]
MLNLYKVCLYLSLFFILNLQTIAQSIKKDSVELNNNLSAATDGYKKFIPNFSPLSPNAASFQKYGDYQVNFSSGVPDINIPLYTVQEGNLSVPITLRYHASGHTMSDFSSWVGWGMNLDAGTSLNRSILGGMADDQATTGNYLTNPIITRNLCSSSQDFTFLNVAQGGNADLEPDLFTYSAAGVSGKFMLGQNGTKPFLMPWQAVDISYQTASDGVIQTFKIKNMEGHIYDFGANTDGTGASEQQNVYPDGSSSGVTEAGIVSWHLAGISSPNNSDAIKFQYQSGGTIQQTYQSWSASVNYDESNNPTAQSVAPIPSRQIKEIKSQNIYKIITSNGEVEFEQSTTNETRLDQPESRYLKQIKVYAYEGTSKNLIKRIVFNYSYFKDRTNANGRLKLDSLQIYGTTLTDPQVYKFDYTTNTYSWKYPTGNVTAEADWSKQDYFGYFNNKNNNHLFDIATYNGGLTPVTILNGTADRSTDETYLKEGLIAKITYPTGGYTTFDFEANRYKNNSIEVLGGGLRVKSIKNYTNVGSLASMKRYEYASEVGSGIGRLSSLWSFPSSASVGEMRYISPTSYLNKMVYLGTNGLSEMSSHDGTPVYYTNVKEYSEESTATNKNGYNEYSFSYEPDIIVNTQYALIRDIEPWKRGLLLKKDVRASDNSLLARTIHQYSSYKEQFITNMGKVLLSNQSNTTCPSCTSGMPYGFDNYGGTPCSYPKLIYLTGTNKTGRQEISQKIERHYKGSDSLEVITNYTYDASNYLQVTQSTTNTSKNEILSTQYKYPYHYNYEPYLTMKAKNMLNPVIEETTLLDNVQIAWRFSDYSTTGSYQNLLKVRVKIGVGTEQTLINFNTYNSRGHLTQYQEKNGITTNITYYGTSSIGKIDLVQSISVGGGSTGTILQRSNSYDYQPLVGLKSQTDLNNYTTSFSYDNFQRLQNIKDPLSFLLEDNYYHYQKQTALTSLGISPDNGSNFRVSRKAIVAQTGNSLVSSVDSTQTQILFVDGLGKETQRILWKASPNKSQDILSSTLLYDAYNRNDKAILPTPSNINTGQYVGVAQNLAKSFYENDSIPFSQSIFEASPLNRLWKQFGAGQNWRVADKFNLYQYLLAGEGISRFDIGSNGAINCTTYTASSLFNDCIASERGIQTYDLKDKQGRVTHKFQQVEANTFNFAVTAFVYNNLGFLSYVIPPEIYKQLGTASGQIPSFTENSDLFKEGIYGYHYDDLGRLISKHISGSDWTEMVYDKNDRLVMFADSTDKANGYWQFLQYDALGKVIRKGIKTGSGSVTRNTLQTAFDAVTTTYEQTGTDLLGYTNQSFPSAYKPIEANVKYVYYYDDYTFNTDVNYSFQSANAFHAQGLTKGLQTGTLIRNLETNDWYKSLNYYDYKGRVIQQFSQNHLGGIDRTDYQYRFNGEMLKMRMTHKKTGASDLVELYQYAYDHLGRKTSFSHNSKVVAKYEYDAIGRLQTKRFSPAGTAQTSSKTGNWTDQSIWQSGNLPLVSDNVTINQGHTITIPSGEIASAGILNDKGTLKNFGTLNFGKNNTADLYALTYQSHIRGGLKGINLDANGNLTNTLFSFKLAYEEGTSGYYDNNIRNQFWKSSIDGIKRAYEYTYDGASRLTAAGYASDKAYESFALNSVAYDLNGNIKSLSRNGATNTAQSTFGNVDNLTYTYQANSNKLLNVQDATTGNTDVGDFRDGNISSNDYDYYIDGSLKKDLNKGIDSIKYNYLKLVKRIKFSNGTWVNYQYDANGKKIKKITSQGITTDYVANKIYESGSLYQISEDEGRIVNGVYEYNITDHNNDLRIAFKDSAGIATPTQSIFYDPWGLSMKGMAITRNPANFNKFQFLNRETQFETGYIDLIHRQFDPQTGRFISQDPVIEGQEHLSLYQYGWNNPILKSDPNGLEPCCGGAVDFVMGFTHAFNEDVSPVTTKLVNSEGGRNYSSGAELGHRAAMLVGAIEIGLGGGAVGGAAYATVTTAGVAAPVAAEVAVGGSAAIAHGVSTIKNAERNLNSEGKYSDLKEPRKVGDGLNTTSAQRKRILEENKKNNGGVLKSDGDGRVLSSPKQSKKGEKMDMNQAEVDHIKPRSKGGSNSNSNQRVISKEENLKKGNREN